LVLLLPQNATLQKDVLSLQDQLRRSVSNQTEPAQSGLSTVVASNWDTEARKMQNEIHFLKKQLLDETAGRAEADEVLQQTQAALEAMSLAAGEAKEGHQEELAEAAAKLDIEREAHRSSVAALERQIAELSNTHQAALDAAAEEQRLAVSAAVSAAVSSERQKLEAMVQLAVDQAEVTYRHSQTEAAVRLETD
jgi:polyhydroxyalkanoate synthesis regulator phasin